MEFSNTVTIQRPVHDVFVFVSDLENVPTWNYAIVETRKVSDGPVRVGTTYRQVRSLPTSSEETLEVTQLVPDRRLVVHGGLGPFEGTLTYEFEDLGGGTRLTNRGDLRPHGLMRVGARVASARISGTVAENLGVLKELLERGTE